MRTTIKEAESNARALQIDHLNYGHYRITAEIRGKRKSCTTTNSRAIDDWNSEFGEKCERTLENRRKRGYTELLDEIIAANY